MGSVTSIKNDFRSECRKTNGNCDELCSLSDNVARFVSSPLYLISKKPIIWYNNVVFELHGPVLTSFIFSRGSYKVYNPKFSPIKPKIGR